MDCLVGEGAFAQVYQASILDASNPRNNQKVTFKVSSVDSEQFCWKILEFYSNLTPPWMDFAEIYLQICNKTYWNILKALFSLCAVMSDAFYMGNSLFTSLNFLVIFFI